MKHHCHALGCKTACASKMLMCRDCWSKVPREIQDEVYATVGKRNKGAIDATWAPWWRAQAKAIHHVAMLKHPDAEMGSKYLAREMDFAKTLEGRT